MPDQVEFVNIYCSWHPASPDPGDDHLVDCANVPLHRDYNVRDFRSAAKSLGLKVVNPAEFVIYLS
ncbi:MAG: hypothetical protein DRI57_12610 [Deltaproteobacteria bacterium]|nr:MAG: hypothetical protein DRI57_12610 [Deltaproteobacteria bacterium]